MVRRSVRLAKPADQPQVFHDLDTAAVSAKSQKLEEAARARKKRRLEYGESTSSADTMIRDAMAGSDDLRDGHKPALYRGSQLNAQLSADDPRSAIVERNSLQSPLLSLPAEVRCVIFEYALGHQHVHILTDDYDTNISVDLPGPARFGVDPPHRREAISQVQARQFHNCVFPIDWRSYYRTKPYKSRPYLVSSNMRHLAQQQRFEHERVITATNDRMALFQAVCRQIYHETRFIPYELNEFSFQDEMTMKDWFGNRAVAQKRVINTVWFDQEWQRSYALFPCVYLGALIHIGKIHGVKKVLILNGVPESAEWTSIRQTKNYQTNSGVTSVTSPDMRCFQNRPGTGTAVVAAGDNLGFVAETSITHFGPVQFYMAKVPDSANVNTWEPAGNVWFKAASISAVGSPLTSGESTWPAYGKSQVQFQIPKNVPSGKYLVRVESIALHQAQSVGGAQMYLSCAQVEITGGGSGQPGPLVAFPGAYNANDPGLRWSYYPIATSYTAPGPAVWQGN